MYKAGRKPFEEVCVVPIHVPLGKLDDIVGQRRRAYAQRPPVQECFVRFSGESVKNLVSKANADMSGSGTTISSLQAMLAHLWRAVCHARGWRLRRRRGTSSR